MKKGVWCPVLLSSRSLFLAWFQWFTLLIQLKLTHSELDISWVEALSPMVISLFCVFASVFLFVWLLVMKINGEIIYFIYKQFYKYFWRERDRGEKTEVCKKKTKNTKRKADFSIWMKKFSESVFDFSSCVRYPKILWDFAKKGNERKTQIRETEEKKWKRMTDSKDLSEPLLSGFEEKVEDELGR